MTEDKITLSYDTTGHLTAMSGSFKAKDCQQYFKNIKKKLANIKS